MKQYDKNLTDNGISVDDVDLNEVYNVAKKIERESRFQLNSMSPEQSEKEKQRQEHLEKMNKLSAQIMQERIESELEMSRLSSEEQAFAYQKINEDAEKYAKNIGAKTIKINKPHTGK